MTDDEKEAWRKDLGMVGIMMESTENRQRPYLGKLRLQQRRQLPRVLRELEAASLRSTSYHLSDQYEPMMIN